MDALSVIIDDEEFDVIVAPPNGCPDLFQCRINGQEVQIILPRPGLPIEDVGWIIVDGRPHEIAFDPGLSWLFDEYGLHRIRVSEQTGNAGVPESKDGIVKAPIPGRILQVLVSPGDRVQAGKAVLVLEAMKMQNEIRACRSGVVTSVFVCAGQCVGQSEKLLEIA